jgi:hypothetical protein
MSLILLLCSAAWVHTGHWPLKVFNMVSHDPTRGAIGSCCKVGAHLLGRWRQSVNMGAGQCGGTGAFPLGRWSQSAATGVGPCGSMGVRLLGRQSWRATMDTGPHGGTGTYLLRRQSQSDRHGHRATWQHGSPPLEELGVLETVHRCLRVPGAYGTGTPQYIEAEA